MIPKVNLQELDGALGLQALVSGSLMALVGVSEAGPLDTPGTFAKVSAVEALYTRGPLVEAAAYAIERYGMPVCVARAETDTEGSYGTLDDSGVTGTIAPAVDGATKPSDRYEIRILFLNDGTIGVSGIKYRTSRDAGRHWSAPTALGTSSSIVVPNTGGVKIDLGAGTVKADDVIALPCGAPAWSPATLAATLAALKVSSLPWEFANVIGDCDGAGFDELSTVLEAMHAIGKHRWGMVSFRLPTTGESEADYLDAFDSEFGAKASSSIVVCAGSARVGSSVTSDAYTSAINGPVGALAATVSAERDLAEIDAAPNGLPGVSIVDTSGNPIGHDETDSPGLDDARALVLRRHEGYSGAYVNNPRLLANTGSDFVFLQFRRVMNIARATLNAYMKRRLSKAVRVNKSTGFIREEEARAIETEANARLRFALLAKPMVSDVTFTLSRTDPLLATFELTGECRLVPLGYPKTITIPIGWNNPGLRAGV